MPIFNAFEMLSRLGGTRIAATTDDAETDIAPGETVGMDRRRPRDEADAEQMEEHHRVLPHPRVDSLAAKSGDAVQVLVWHQVCDQYAGGQREVNVRVAGLDGWERAVVRHWRISEGCSNAHTVWKALGRPDWPSEAQVALMKERERLEKCQPDRTELVRNGEIVLRTSLPMHSVSMYELWGR
jgi:xylan 1,4-beta-xylosidase